MVSWAWEVSGSHIQDMLPSSELNKNEQSGYMLVKSTEKNRWRPLVASGILGERLKALGTVLNVEDSKFDQVYILNEDKADGELYASAKSCIFIIPTHLLRRKNGSL